MKRLYDKIMSFVGGIPADKALHFIAGLMIVAVTAIVFPCAANYAVVSAVIAGFFKEAIDKFEYGGWSWWDLVATAIGGFVMQIIIWII